MLNPEQVGRLRHMLSAGHRTETFDGCHLASGIVSIAPDRASPDVLFETPPMDGALYEPERIFGAPVDPSCLDGIGARTIDFPARQIIRVSNARVVGNTVVLDAAGTLYNPEHVSTENRLANALGLNATDHQGFVLQWCEYAAVATFVSAEQPRKLPINALFLHNMEPGNYGSFLLRQLLQMQVPSDLFAAYDCYVVPDRTPWLTEAFMLLGLPDRPVYTVRRLHSFQVARRVCQRFDRERAVGRA